MKQGVENMDIKEKFINMIKESWTYNKMTKEEQERCINLFYSDIRVKDSIKYIDAHKWDVMQAIYSAYLQGLGYNGFEWREK